MFTGLQLAQRLERTEAHAGAAFVEARGGTSAWVEIVGAYAMFDGATSPLTQTFGLGMFETATEAELSKIEEFFQTRGAPVHHEICPLAGVALLRTLAERGYVPLEISNVLFLELAEARFPAPDPGFMIRTAGRTDADAYNRAAAQGWSDVGDVSQLIGDMAKVLLAAHGYTGFLVEQNARVIATAGLVIHDGVALLAGASTIPEARGQGAQGAVLSARLQYAVDAGCDIAMFVAEPGGASHRNAERCGFRVAYTRIKWLLAPTANAQRS